MLWTCFEIVGGLIVIGGAVGGWVCMAIMIGALREIRQREEADAEKIGRISGVPVPGPHESQPVVTIWRRQPRRRYSRRRDG